MNRKDVGVQISNIYCFLHAPRRFRQHLSFLHSVSFCIKGRDSKRSNGSQPLIAQCGIPEDERRNLLRIRCKYNPSSRLESIQFPLEFPHSSCLLLKFIDNGTKDKLFWFRFWSSSVLIIVGCSTCRHLPSFFFCPRSSLMYVLAPMG